MPQTKRNRSKLDVDELKITNHAVARFKERRESNLDDNTVRKIIKDLLVEACPVEYKDPAEAVRALIRHKCERAQYFRRAGLIFVVSTDNTVLTVHKGEARQWRPVFD